MRNCVSQLKHVSVTCREQKIVQVATLRMQSQGFYPAEGDSHQGCSGQLMFIGTTTLTNRSLSHFSDIWRVLVTMKTFPYRASEQSHQGQAEIYSKHTKYFLKKQLKRLEIQALGCAQAKMLFEWNFRRKVKKRNLLQILGRHILPSRCNYSVTTALILHSLLKILWSEITFFPPVELVL